MNMSLDIDLRKWLPMILINIEISHLFLCVYVDSSTKSGWIRSINIFSGLWTQILPNMKTLSLTVFGLFIFHAAVGAKGNFQIFQFNNRELSSADLLQYNMDLRYIFRFSIIQMDVQLESFDQSKNTNSWYFRHLW